MEKKHIVIIPANGVFIKQDLTLHKIAMFFKECSHIKVTVLFIKDESQIDILSFFDNYIHVPDLNALVEELKNLKYDLAIHRCWMHRYKFAGILAENFSNMVFYIKDWFDEMSKEEYKFLFKTDEDYEGIKKLFCSKNKVLSHYGHTYTNKLVKKYNLSKKQFMFFPEYCSKENFHFRTNISYSNEKKLLYAAQIVSTSKPENLSEAKQIFNTMKKFTKQKVLVDFITLPFNYDRIFDPLNQEVWADYLYEHYFNEYFKIKKGIAFDATIFQEYHFGIPGGLYYNKKDVTCINACNAITSKISLYLEAGIPLLVNKKWKELAKLVVENDIGILVNNDDLDNINKKLRISQKRYIQLVENVYKFREKFTYNNKTMKPILEMLA